MGKIKVTAFDSEGSANKVIGVLAMLDNHIQNNTNYVEESGIMAGITEIICEAQKTVRDIWESYFETEVALKTLREREA